MPAAPPPASPLAAPDDTPDAAPQAAVAWLARLMRQGPFVAITGAGLSTASGIPAYRDALGQWQHPRPVQHQAFLRDEAVRRRYWARSFVGWQTIGQAAPNAGHLALAELARLGHISLVVTQNVDGLHHKAGSPAVLDLHGRISRVRCMGCGQGFERALVQHWLADANAHMDLAELQALRTAPDGDAHLHEAHYVHFQVPPCPACGGMLKPDVVFFGDNVPRERVAAASQALTQSQGLLVVGSSLMVYSGYRYAEQAHREGKPLVAINQGVTRADALLTTKIDLDCSQALAGVLQALQGALEAPLKRPPAPPC
jgi:NAD-dependent SIR2 family protein deacetylase